MRSFFDNIPPVTKNLLIINVLLWGAMALVPSLNYFLTAHFALYFPGSPGFGVWETVSYMFLHNGFTHLFFNMFALLVFGRAVEWAMGSGRFLFYYLSCGIFAGLFQMGVFAIMLAKYHNMLDPEQFDYVVREGFRLLQQHYNFTDPTLSTINALVNTPMVGASGAVFGVILAMGMLFPNQPMYIMFIPVPVKAKWLVIGYAVIELMAGFGNMADNVAHFAHLGGMIVGLLLILYWRRKGVFNNHWFF